MIYPSFSAIVVLGRNSGWESFPDHSWWVMEPPFFSWWQMCLETSSIVSSLFMKMSDIGTDMSAPCEYVLGILPKIEIEDIFRMVWTFEFCDYYRNLWHSFYVFLCFGKLKVYVFILIELIELLALHCYFVFKICVWMTFTAQHSTDLDKEFLLVLQISIASC